MSQYGWGNCPADVREQIDTLIDSFRFYLAENAIGVYLHGSLAMECFNPQRSDLDLLVITHDQMSAETKRCIAELLLNTSLHPSGIEISFLRHADMVPWQYPTPFDFHYSEDWRSAFVHDLNGDAWKEWNAVQRYDEDLAAHIAVMNYRGICLYGPAIGDIFPVVPQEDFIASILGDVLSTKFGLNSDVEHPVYVILNACRTYAYLRTGNILSKDEGGVWALQVLPEQFHATVVTALDAYRSQKDDSSLSKDAVVNFADYLRNEFKRVLCLSPVE